MRVYAVREDNGKRVLIEIQCDGCGAVIKPNPDISDSGWSKTGYQDNFGESWARNDWCPACQLRNRPW